MQTKPGWRNDLDLRRLVEDSTRKVFEMMLSLNVKCEDDPLGTSHTMPGMRIAGSLGFAGEGATGGVYLQFPEPFARRIAASALALADAKTACAADINDVVGELCNMIGGTIASRLSDMGFNCRPTIPFITRGANFEVELAGGMAPQVFAFAHGTDRFVVGIYVNTAKA